MGVEMNVILGLGLVSGIFAYYAMEFLATEDFWTLLVGKIFFIVSNLLLLLLINSVFLIIKNNGLTYLSDTVGDTMLMVFYYMMVIGIVVFILYMFVQIGVMLYDGIGNYFGTTRKTNKKKSSGEQDG